MEDAAQFLPDPCSDGLTRSAMDAPLLLLVAEAAVLLVTSSAAYFWALWLERGAQAGRPEPVPKCVGVASLRSSDDLVGVGEEGGRKVEPEGVRGREVDNQRDPCRLLHGQVARLRAIHDLVDE